MEHIFQEKSFGKTNVTSTFSGTGNSRGENRQGESCPLCLHRIFSLGGDVLSDAGETLFLVTALSSFLLTGKMIVLKTTNYQEISAGCFPALFFIFVSGPKEKTEAKRRILRFRL